MKVPALFSDDMMLQAGVPVMLWGWDRPAQHIQVTIAEFTLDTDADHSGEWSVMLPALSMGKRCEISIMGSHTYYIRNVLVGDVWLCSGQSNMAMKVKESREAEDDVAHELHSEIRIFTVQESFDGEKKSDVLGTWRICSSETVQDFSAVGYFFGREIHLSQGIPVGLIDASSGGSRIEAWMSFESLASRTYMRDELTQYEKSSPAEAQADYEKAYALWREHLPRNPSFSDCEREFSSYACDDSQWPEIDLPDYWTNKGIASNGVLWFRKDFFLSESDLTGSASLSLGAIDKSDNTFVNGTCVGSLSIDENPDAWSLPRTYTIPHGILRAGKNSIAVRVFSNLHSGGFSGHSSEMALCYGDLEKTISLSGRWKYAIAHDFGDVMRLMPPPEAPYGPGNNNSPHILYDNMIFPLQNFQIKGVLWYQGESNTRSHVEYYADLLELLIAQWRSDWRNEQLLFFIVQLPNYNSHLDTVDSSPWSRVRVAQEEVRRLHGVDTAICLDLGEIEDIHPRSKQQVGHRLALLARHHLYGGTDVWCGPRIRDAVIDAGGITLSFTFVERLSVRGGDLNSEIRLLIDSEWVAPRTVEIRGDQLFLHCDADSGVQAVRYGWRDAVSAWLYNEEGLPLAPFECLPTRKRDAV
jgi:sialate O-acetylesterase